MRLVVSETCRLRLVPMGVILWTLGLWNAEGADNNILYCMYLIEKKRGLKRVWKQNTAGYVRSLVMV